MGFENGHLLRVTLRASVGVQEVVNTFHYDLNDHFASPGSDPQTLADLFRDNVRPQWATLFRPAWTLDPVVIVDEKDPLNPLAARSAWSSGAPIAGTGAGTGDLLPSFISPVVKLITSRIGRRFTGRTWLGCAAEEAWQANGLWTAGMMTAFTTVMNSIPKQPDLVTGVSAAEANWCVYSRTQRAANLDPYASAVQSFVVRPQLHALRKRAS